MRWRTNGLLGLAGLLLLLAGCQRLHFEKSITVNPGQTKFYEIDAPSGDQKVELKVTATEPVSAFIVLEKELKDVETKNSFDKDKALAKKIGATNDTLQATVPAKSKFGVVIMGGVKQAEVKIVLDAR